MMKKLLCLVLVVTMMFSGYNSAYAYELPEDSVSPTSTVAITGPLPGAQLRSSRQCSTHENITTLATGISLVARIAGLSQGDLDNNNALKAKVISVASRLVAWATNQVTDNVYYIRNCYYSSDGLMYYYEYIYTDSTYTNIISDEPVYSLCYSILY